MTSKDYCGILDSEGLRTLAVRTVASAADFYKDSELSDTQACYFEISLSESEADIFATLNKQSDAVGAAKALIQFGGDDISVPDSDTESWDEILKLLNLNKNA